MGFNPGREVCHESSSRCELHVDFECCAGVSGCLGRGIGKASKNRETAAKLMTPEQIAEAQRLETEWVSKHEKKNLFRGRSSHSEATVVIRDQSFHPITLSGFPSLRMPRPINATGPIPFG